MEHGQVVLGLLGLAYQQMAEAVEPRVGALHHPTGTAPAAGFLARFLRLDFFASWVNAGYVARCGDYFVYLGLVVTCIQAQIHREPAGQVRLPGGFRSRW